MLSIRDNCAAVIALLGVLERSSSAETQAIGERLRPALVAGPLLFDAAPSKTFTGYPYSEDSLSGRCKALLPVEEAARFTDETGIPITGFPVIHGLLIDFGSLSASSLGPTTPLPDLI